jgi:uncharacterized membrane protein YcaP (DUF421 family)
MEPILRAAAVYIFLLLIIRISGRRTLGEMTNFDFVLLLIISEATQNAMIGEDYSVTNGALVVLTLVGLDVLLSHVKRWSEAAEMWLDGKPTIIVEQGQPKTDLMQRARIDEDDVLMAARETQGLERMEQIKYAVLETSGGISIIPR